MGNKQSKKAVKKETDASIEDLGKMDAYYDGTWYVARVRKHCELIQCQMDYMNEDHWYYIYDKHYDTIQSIPNCNVHYNCGTGRKTIKFAQYGTHTFQQSPAVQPPAVQPPSVQPPPVSPPSVSTPPVSPPKSQRPNSKKKLKTINVVTTHPKSTIPTTSQYQYWHSKSEKQSYLIAKNENGISSYNITRREWNEVISFTSYPWMKNCVFSTDRRNNKLYALCKQLRLFCVFDLETKKFNLIKAISWELWEEYECALSLVPVSIAEPDEIIVDNFFYNDAKIYEDNMKVIRINGSDKSMIMRILKENDVEPECVITSKIKPDDTNFECDAGLNCLLSKTIFFYHYESKGVGMIKINRKGVNVESDTFDDYPINCMIFVRQLRRLYMFRTYGASSENLIVDIYYIQFDLDGSFENEVFKIETVNVGAIGDLLSFVLVMETIILIFNRRNGRILAVDTFKGKVVWHERKLNDGILKNKVSDIVYDERNRNIYAFEPNGSYHMMDVWNTVPRECVEEEAIVYGYMRRNINELYMMIPSCLWELVLLYFRSD